MENHTRSSAPREKPSRSYSRMARPFSSAHVRRTSGPAHRAASARTQRSPAPGSSAATASSSPPRTALLQQAERLGLRAENGLSMLAEQAIHAAVEDYIKKHPEEAAGLELTKAE